MTSHVFIVDTTTFKYHLEYQFVGTGMKDVIIDFNNSCDTKLNFQTENTLLGLIVDFICGYYQIFARLLTDFWRFCNAR